MIREDLVPINTFSRPGVKLLSVEKLVIHYFGNKATTADQNVQYIKSLSEQDDTDSKPDRYASAHFFVDSKEIINCIPEDERAYHVGAKKYTPYGRAISSYPNARTIGIEMYHPTKTGKPDIMTYARTVKLCAALCIKYKLSAYVDICRHYDITGKECPLYYVDNPNEFILFKDDVEEEMKTCSI